MATGALSSNETMGDNAMAKQGKVAAVCISRQKGQTKKSVDEARLRPDYGVEGDAHAGTGRQVSLLCRESADKIRAAGLEIGPGDFAENLLVEGLAPDDFELGVRFRLRDEQTGDQALLEVTQIGKECHEGCAIREAVGDCVMPREGVFARVLRGGAVRPGAAVILEVK